MCRTDRTGFGDIKVIQRNDFGYGLDSTSYIESVWGILQSEIKCVYATIRPKNFLYFLKEAEFKVKNIHLTNNQKIEKFLNFIIYFMIVNVI